MKKVRLVVGLVLTIFGTTVAAGCWQCGQCTTNPDGTKTCSSCFWVENCPIE